MKNLLFIVVILMSHLALFGQKWEWLKSQGEGEFDYALSVAADKTGNVYMAGRIGGVSGKIFLAKYDTNGNLLWTKIPGEGCAFAVTVDIYDNIYVTGYFTSPKVSFDSIVLNKQSNSDIFLVKYRPNGNVTWAKRAGGNDPYYGSVGASVTTDLNGDVYICGSFNNAVLLFDTITVSNLYSGVNQNRNLFLAKYDWEGNPQWAKVAGGNYESESADAHSVATDGFGNVYITGWFDCSSITFGPYILALQNSSNIWGDMFIVKYDKNGHEIWAKSEGNNHSVWGFSVASDNSGNVYVAGGFDCSLMVFGSDTLSKPQGHSGNFIVKYNDLGNIAWANQFGNTENSGASVHSISIDIFGKIVMTGELSISGSVNMFLTRYDTNGNILMSLKAQGNNNVGNAVATDKCGNVYVVGNFVNDGIFLAPHYASHIDGAQMFISKFRMNVSNSPCSPYTDVVTETINQTSATILKRPLFNEKTEEMTVFPNPAGKTFTVNFSSSIKAELFVGVKNELGQLIYSETKDNFQGEYTNTINLSKQPPGVYFVEVVCGQERRAKKIIVK